MSIEALVLVNVVGRVSSLNKTLTRIAESELFHLEKAEQTSKTKNFKALNEKNPYSSTLKKIEKLFQMLEIEPKFNDYTSLKFKKIEEINNIVSESFDEISKKIKLAHNIKTEISSVKKSVQQLSCLNSLGPIFNNISSAKFVSCSFGKMTLNNKLKLDYFKNKNFFFIPLKSDKNYCWGLFIYMSSEQQQFNEIASSIYFEQHYSSAQNEEKPDLLIKKLNHEVELAEIKLENLKLEIKNYKAQHALNLLCIYSKIKTLHSSFNYRKFAISNNKFFYINGFVLEKNLKSFKNLFEEFNDVVVEVLPAKPVNRNGSHFNLPVKLKTSALFKPFELLIETFGLPAYGSANPTSFVGFVYCFLFGLMFGDVGQGACLFAAGITFWLWKKSNLGLVLTRCSISSCVFGLIYDSCFGFEGYFEGFWHKIKILPNFPFNLLKGKNAVVILVVSLILGMVLITIAIFTNIVINLKNKNYKQATISSNGLTGLVIYGCGITATTISILLFKTNILTPAFFCLTILAPSFLIFLEKPIFNFVNLQILKKDQKKEEFNFLNSLLETFETILNYLTNTLSFLRVGGFAMSHAALMLVVVKFCEKCSGTIASPLIAVFGNAFVIALEGMVVSIQVLRLIYYEMFSRFYKSNGKKFEPAKIIF